jgi:hypothetical protein
MPCTGAVTHNDLRSTVLALLAGASDALRHRLPPRVLSVRELRAPTRRGSPLSQRPSAIEACPL